MSQFALLYLSLPCEVNPFALKIPLLLTQFLYTNKKLALPGIGIFTLDPATVIPEEQSKDGRGEALNIQFIYAATHEPDSQLIDFIRQHTGKMRSLAVADLESYLTLGTELLNIGKPFYLEGIGTLTKDKDGRFAFTPGEFTLLKREDAVLDRADKSARKNPTATTEEQAYGGETQAPRGLRVVLLAVIVAGLAVVAFGGYILYKKNAPRTPDKSQVSRLDDSPSARPDTSALHGSPVSDSAKAKLVAQPDRIPSGDSVMYKFIILDTHNKSRALRRYNQLLSYDLNVKLFQKDSAYFKVYFLFPSLVKDTSRIKDSLMREYAHSVHIERP